MAERTSKAILAKGIRLDRNYKNILNYTESSMLTLVQNKAVASNLNCSFLRDEGVLQLDIPYGTALTADYLAFQNPAYSNKWFFAFIDKVEYTDGSVDYVESEFEIVVPLTDEYDPQGKTVTIEKGTPVKVTDFIVAPEELPEGTQLEFYPEPNVDIEGTRNVGVRVTYPDGSMDYVRSSITVTEPPADEALGDIYEPQVQELTVEKGADVKPIDFITNASDLPEGTIFTYDFEPDVDTVGESYASVVVAYPDGSMDYVHVTLTVTEPPAEDNEPLADIYRPRLDGNKTIYKGTKIEAIEFITNVADLPEGTTFSYDFAPDVDTVGEATTRIMITYPDGSVDFESVTFDVIDRIVWWEDDE